MLAKLKLWLVVGGGLFVTGATLLLYFFGLGRSVERAEGIKDAARAQEKHNDRVNNAVTAGDDARIAASDPDRLRVDDGHKRKRKTQ